MKSSPLKYLPGLALGIFSIVSTAHAALITTIPVLPPLGGVYLSTDVHQIFGGPALQFILTLPEHAPIAEQASRHPGGLAGTVGTPADEIEDFPSNFEGMVDVLVDGNSITGGPQPVSASGPVQTIVFGKIGNVTGTFDTEMLQMNLSGNTPLGPFMIRESPTKQSTGITSIADIGGGQFRIDSFFDVFTELSIDGGQTWMPATNGSGHVELVPEPSSMVLCGLGIAAVGLAAVRRRKQQ